MLALGEVGEVERKRGGEEEMLAPGEVLEVLRDFGLKLGWSENSASLFLMFDVFFWCAFLSYFVVSFILT